MNLPQRGGDWGTLGAYVLLSLVLYSLGAIDALFFLFAVPLQVLYLRKGREQFLLGSAAVIAGIALFALWRTSSIAAGQLRGLVISVELLADLSIIAGVFVVNTDWPRLPRRLYRLLAVTGAAGIVSLPFVLMLAGSKEFSMLMQNQVKQVVSMLNSSFGGANQSASPAFNAGELTAYIRQIVLRNYLFTYFVILTGVWRIGLLFALRSRMARPRPLAMFALPVGILWPTLVVWGGVAADRLLHLGVFGYATWNLAMIGAFLYGLQGIGIVQHLFARFNVARGIRMLLVAVVLFLLIIPGLATIIVIAFPILGISELWIRYGRDAAKG